MFPTTMTRDHGHIRRILIVGLATLMLFATLAIANTTPAEAHSWDVTADCHEWAVVLTVYGTSGDNSVEVWVDDLKVTDIANFGAGFSQSASWDPTTDHSLRVKVVAYNDPTGSRDWTFDTTQRSEACLGTIIVEKQTDPDGSLESFEFSTDYGANFTLVDDATNNSGPLDPGTYSVSEINLPQNWSLTSATCDDESSPAAIGLDAGETVICTFENTYDPPLVPSIDIEKATNGQDADDPTGPTITVDDPVNWTYVVTNTGDVDLVNVNVVDNMEVSVTCPKDALVVDESMTCTASGTATLGQYANMGTVTGFYPQMEQEVTDEDPSHYLGVAAPVPSIDIEKATNGEDADTWEDVEIPLASGAVVTWTYVVTNPGNVALGDVVVTDNMGVVPIYEDGDTNTNGLLEPTETWTYTAIGTVGDADYENLGTVTGVYLGNEVADTDPSRYKVAPQVEGTAQLGDTVWLDANNNGIQDNGEVGYNGAKVILTDADGNVVETLTTATGAWVGFYKFVGLDAGTYTATLNLSTIGDYGVTTAKAFTVVLAEGDDFTQADFGLYAEEELPKTGVGSEGLTLVALGLLMLGTLAVISTRSRRAEER